MNVEPNILFTVHKGAPFRRWWCDNHNLLQEGRPFIMRFRQLTSYEEGKLVAAKRVARLSFQFHEQQHEDRPHSDCHGKLN